MDPGGIFIHGKEIYDAVIRLTGRVDVLIEGQAHLTDDSKDHENRLRSLERSRWPLPSVAVLVALGSLVLAYFK